MHQQHPCGAKGLVEKLGVEVQLKGNLQASRQFNKLTNKLTSVDLCLPHSRQI
jgi:hypothetical protein